MSVIKAITPRHLNKVIDFLNKNFCAPTAKKLDTPIKINGVSFDGSRDIDINFVPDADAAPVSGSSRLVTSGGVHKAIQDAISEITDGDNKTY